MNLIQGIVISTNLLFLTYIARLIIKGRLREEYAIVWIISTVLLLFFSFWREGLEKVAQALGVFVSMNLVFAAAIFAVLVYLLHLSVVASKLQKQNRQIAQELAILKEKFELQSKSESHL